jgi:hypothetical protein
LADSAALDNARGNIQMLGGIGMTDEAYPHLLLERAHLLSFVVPADARLLIEAAPADATNIDGLRTSLRVEESRLPVTA